MLQPTLNASSSLLFKILKDGLESTDNRLEKIVDVRDVADALLLAYEKPEAEGRYICTLHMIKVGDLVEKLKSIYPHYNYPKSFLDVEEEEHLSSERLQNLLGWRHRALEITLIDSVEATEKLEF